MKRALITGGTDGIGKGAALALAKKGYEVHITGRSEEKAQAVISELKKQNPQGKHRMFLYDLADVEKNIDFLKTYTSEFGQLDFLLLNANPLPLKTNIMPSGYDNIFMIGFVSRYLYCKKLAGLLEKTKGSRVMHIFDNTMARSINFERLKNPTYGGLRSISNAYMADANMAYNLSQTTNIAHELMSPGYVNTSQVSGGGKIYPMQAKLFKLIEPSELGGIIADHTKTLSPSKVNGKCFKRNKEASVKKAIKDKASYLKLAKIAYQITGV